MSQKQAKRVKRIIRKEIDNIKIVGLNEFLAHAKKQSFWKRLKFAWKIIKK
jgi:hypothetical protein